MAKARRQKNEEQKPESSGGVVLHQKLCLSIDMENKRIYGYTELKVLLQEGEHIALHADNINVRSISVDGEPSEFEYFPHYQDIDEEKRWSSVSCSKSAADLAGSTYISSLNKETVANLIISCHQSMKSENEQHIQENGGNIVQSSSEEQIVNDYNGLLEDKNVKLVRIDYLIDRADTGIHFAGDMLHTNNQIRRAHCWFPCMDNVAQRCSFDLEFTVSTNLVAVSNGNLLYQVLSKDDPPRKTYVYKLNTPVSADWISLVVGPFKILPDCQNSVLSHMCLPPNFSKLQNTVGFFHNAFSYYEDYLSISYPFGSYKQIFIPSDLTTSSMSLGASMCIFSSDVLYDEKIIDQTINTRIKLAYALARQWFGVYITAEEQNDEWLLNGLAGFLTDNFIKRFLGNNEARYRRFKANCAVCKADVCGATALSSSAASGDLYGTQTIGLYGKIRSWKAVTVFQMLEKQMGPDSFRKILQMIVSKAPGPNRSSRTLSTKEFRHLANKVGNLERPFLKEFFPRWVESCGCPIMRMGISYNKRRNMVELAVMRDCTAKGGSISGSNPDNEIQEGGAGWPGMMSIRVHELDGMYDHPILPMAGESWQLLEVQCHCKLAAKRIQKPKKGLKHDGSDDNADAVTTQDIRTGTDSPLLWIRVDPEMEYLAEIHLHQPVQMWINQLEKDKDVIAQSQAIAEMEKLPQLPFSVVNTLNNFLNDTKAFWRVRVEAAYALALTASEETDLAGLLHLIKFYKSRRFDEHIGLPRPNDFRDVPEYFVLEAIPHAVALIRAADKKSPREAIEFVLQLLKYNDNNGNPYSDVYWLAAMVQAIGELEFGQQTVLFLSSLLKRIDRLLQFDSLMPSYNGILTISCIRALSQIALKMSTFIPLDRACELIKPFRSIEKTWKVRIEASRVLLDLEFHCKGLEAAISLFLKFLDEEPSLRGETKLAGHVCHLCQVNLESHTENQISCTTLVGLLRLLASRRAFNNVFLRHQLFCILQVLAGRSPTLYGVPKVLPPMVSSETYSDQHVEAGFLKLKISRPQDTPIDIPNLHDASPIAEAAKETDNISNSSERRMNILKIRVKQTGSSSKTDDVDHQMDLSRAGPNENELGPCSSVSVDAPIGGVNEPLNISTQNNEEVNSSHDRESRMTASIGSAKLGSKFEISKELQCTADSRLLSKDQLSHVTIDGDEVVHKTVPPLQAGSVVSHDGDQAQLSVGDHEAKEKRKKDKKEKDKKRKREDRSDKKDDPQYLERKRLKKEKKRMEKEQAKMRKDVERASSSELQNLMKSVESHGALTPGDSNTLQGVEPHVSTKETTADATQASTAPKIRIKIKSLSIGNI
ncbi:transcription initiation factor TFIID subunit 2 [Typha latifolia]|uniref:transcription initiation factor TFIID subunit 2 n=1 Tax=Typha latifolia TaxID=4733 RepID=UPI003C304CD3